MEGEETNKMFRKSNCKARVAYLNGSKAIEAPPGETMVFKLETKKVFDKWQSIFGSGNLCLDFGKLGFITI